MNRHLIILLPALVLAACSPQPTAVPPRPTIVPEKSKPVEITELSQTSGKVAASVASLERHAKATKVYIGDAKESAAVARLVSNPENLELAAALNRVMQDLGKAESSIGHLVGELATLTTTKDNLILQVKHLGTALGDSEREKLQLRQALAQTASDKAVAEKSAADMQTANTKLTALAADAGVYKKWIVGTAITALAAVVLCIVIWVLAKAGKIAIRGP